ncbi:MAG: response regulator [Anaerolineales bacterium]
MTAKKLKILAVEDDQSAWQLLKLALRPLPVEVIHASTGHEAISYLNREQPALIFLDIHLPDMHGWQVLEAVKDQGRLAETPIIVLTASKEPVHRLIGNLQSVALYMNKPFRQEELRERVRELLQL